MISIDDQQEFLRGLFKFLDPEDDLERQKTSPRAPQQTPVNESLHPLEIYASGGGLLMAPINVPE